MSLTLALESDREDAARALYWTGSLLSRMGIDHKIEADPTTPLPTGIPGEGTLISALQGLREGLPPPTRALGAALRVRYTSDSPAGPHELTCWSDGWTVWINKRPSSRWDDPNPIAAAVAGATIANILADLDRSTAAPSFALSLLDYTHSEARGRLEHVTLPEFLLIGVGSIGSGFILALAGLVLSGAGHFADKQRLGPTNVKRYVSMLPKQVGTLKVDAAAEILGAAGFQVDPLEKSGTEAIHLLPAHVLPLTALDTGIARRGIAEDLPREVIDAAVDSEDGRIELFHATFPPTGACLACLYPRPGPQSVYQRMAGDFGIPIGEVFAKLQENYCIEQDFIDRVKQATGRILHVNTLGESLDTAWRGFCAAGYDPNFQESSEDRDSTPSGAALPALAGALLAAELTKRALGLPTVSNFFGWTTTSAPNPDAHRRRNHDPRCTVCSDPDYVVVYADKYGGGS